MHAAPCTTRSSGLKTRLATATPRVLYTCNRQEWNPFSARKLELPYQSKLEANSSRRTHAALARRHARATSPARGTLLPLKKLGTFVSSVTRALAVYTRGTAVSPHDTSLCRWTARPRKVHSRGHHGWHAATIGHMREDAERYLTPSDVASFRSRSRSRSTSRSTSTSKEHFAQVTSARVPTQTTTHAHITSYSAR